MSATRQINQAAATPEAPPTAGQTSMDMGAVALLPLPNVTRLSGLQARGAACVWCLAQLTIETAVDLGERPGPDGVTVFPRSCGRCVREKADDVYELHVSQCGACTRNQYCADRTDLRRLASEGAP